MRALVSAASRHGSTREIAAVVATALARAGVDVDHIDPQDVFDVGHYDALVVGSGVYLGQWLAPARDMLERVGPQLPSARVWLFSSGLSGKAPTITLRTPGGDVEPVEHRHFPGNLDVLQLSLAERAAILAARGTYGDARDLDAVRAWAEQVGRTVTAAAHAR